MAKTLGDIADKVRSKNAGPFWLTIDVFCGAPDRYDKIRSALQTAEVAKLIGADAKLVKRFEIADLNVVKFSLPRPVIQGASAERDMHGAAWAVLLAEMEIGG